MTDLIQLPAEDRVVSVLAHAFGGLHHVRGFKEHALPDTPWWECTVSTGDLCTVDSEGLSCLVIASLEYGVRVELDAAGPRRIKLRLHPRYSRGGACWERIPRVSDVLSQFAPASRLERVNEILRSALKPVEKSPASKEVTNDPL